MFRMPINFVLMLIRGEENPEQFLIKGKHLLVCLLEDLALVELAALLVGATPREVVGHQFLGLFRVRVELFPVVRLVINLPIGAQLQSQQTTISPIPSQRLFGNQTVLL